MTEPYRVLLASLRDVGRGEFVTSDTWHDQAALAQLTSAEKAAAQQQAIDDGYLERVLVRLGDRRAAVQVPSTTPSRKGGGVQLHIRTGKALPGEPAPVEHHTEAAQIPGKATLLEVGT